MNSRLTRRSLLRPQILSVLCLVLVSQAGRAQYVAFQNAVPFVSAEGDSFGYKGVGPIVLAGGPPLSALPDLPEPRLEDSPAAQPTDLALPHFSLDLQASQLQNLPYRIESSVVREMWPQQQAPSQAQPPVQAKDTPSITSDSVAQENADFGTLSVNGVDVGEAWDNVQHMMPPGFDLDGQEVPIIDPSEEGYGATQPYNWHGLLAESLFFNIVENSFRAASDDQIRDMLTNKPFWHDWLASMKQFNMRRWNDGDDFLVNYVGHPLQGAVTGFIEIQNDPVGRQLRISATREYWESRFKAFLWATAYSTHSEISPDGEAGIGNEGGWTYPIKCKIKGCPNWTPKMHYTNNTGWVDFTITPTVGILWLLAEDTLDRYISDRVQGDDRFNLMPMFLRAALNPSRSMANAMRFKAPWYRDFQHDPEIEDSYQVRVLPTEEEIAEAGPLRRLAISPYFHSMPFGSGTEPCILCFGSSGLGVGVDYAFNRWIGLSFAAENAGGLVPKGSVSTTSSTNIGLGLRVVRQGRTGSLSFAIRPGIVSNTTLLPLRLDGRRNMYFHPQQSVENTAVTLELSDEYKVTKAIAVRYSVENTIVRYQSLVKEPAGIGKPPYLTWLSKDDYINKSNWSCQAGPVLRF